jgi:hypothetical protein
LVEWRPSDAAVTTRLTRGTAEALLALIDWYLSMSDEELERSSAALQGINREALTAYKKKLEAAYVRQYGERLPRE